MRIISTVLLLTALAAGCATITVSSHVERDIDFTAYATYDWGPRDQFPVGDLEGELVHRNRRAGEDLGNFGDLEN